MMKFDEFQKLTRKDLSEFKDRFIAFYDFGPLISTTNVGFLIQFSDEQLDETARIIKLLKPLRIFVGHSDHLKKLQKMCISTKNVVVSSYFEDNGFLQVAAIPI